MPIIVPIYEWFKQLIFNSNYIDELKLKITLFVFSIHNKKYKNLYEKSYSNISDIYKVMNYY